MTNRTRDLLDILSGIYPEPKCELNYETPFQLLVGTILAAQATDKKVNEVTKVLFSKYKTVEDFLMLNQEELEAYIKQINLYKTKARHILGMCRILKEEYKSQVPQSREDLVKLPGVGRKTANVILSYAFGVPAIAVDTHVFRVANRIGLTNARNVSQAEQQLEKSVPQEAWSRTHSGLVLHGRRVCDAKKPKCEICLLSGHCNYYNARRDKEEAE